MMNLKMRIMCRAVKIRMDRGEKLEEILDSYPNLSREERDKIKNNI